MTLSDWLALAILAIGLAGAWRYRRELRPLPDDRVTLGRYARARRALERVADDVNR